MRLRAAFRSLQSWSGCSEWPAMRQTDVFAVLCHFIWPSDIVPSRCREGLELSCEAAMEGCRQQPQLRGVERLQTDGRSLCQTLRSRVSSRSPPGRPPGEPASLISLCIQQAMAAAAILKYMAWSEDRMVWSGESDILAEALICFLQLLCGLP